MRWAVWPFEADRGRGCKSLGAASNELRAAGAAREAGRKNRGRIGARSSTIRLRADVECKQEIGAARDTGATLAPAGFIGTYGVGIIAGRTVAPAAGRGAGGGDDDASFCCSAGGNVLVGRRMVRSSVSMRGRTLPRRFVFSTFVGAS